MKKLRAYLLIGGISVLLLSCSENETENEVANTTPTETEITKVVGVARIEPENGLLYIYSSTNGKVASINVNSNEIVEEGAVLLNLENATDLAQLDQEKTKISSQKSSVKASETNAELIKADLKKAKEDLELNKKLFASKAITEQVLNDSKAKVSKLEIEYEKYVADIELSKSKLPEIVAGIQYKEALLNEKQVKAAYKGKVLQWDIHKGDYITAGQKLGQFAPEGSLVAVTEVDELFANKVKIGMKAEVFSQANGEMIGTGTVIWVADYLKKKSLFSDENTVEDRRVREVKIRLDNSTTAMINNRVDCTIYLK